MDDMPTSCSVALAPITSNKQYFYSLSFLWIHITKSDSVHRIMSSEKQPERETQMSEHNIIIWKCSE